MKPATRYPTDPRAVFVLALCVVSGLPLLFGYSQPNTIESVMAKWVVIAWGALLTVGAAATLFGMAVRTVTGVVIEQIGSVAVGGATIFYAAAIFLSLGLNGGVAAGIILGWGMSCFWRWAQLQKLLNNAASEIKMVHDDAAQKIDKSQGMDQDKAVAEAGNGKVG